MSYPATVRVVVVLDVEHPSVVSLGDMKSMYSISQAIRANSSGAALIRCGYASAEDEYYVELSKPGHEYTSPEEFLPLSEQVVYGVKSLSFTSLAD